MLSDARIKNEMNSGFGAYLQPAFFRQIQDIFGKFHAVFMILTFFRLEFLIFTFW